MYATMFGCVFGSFMAKIWREAMCSSEGPTIPFAPSTPGTMWQELQPYCSMSCLPRLGSPTVGEADSGRLQAAASSNVSGNRFKWVPSGGNLYEWTHKRHPSMRG